MDCRKFSSRNGSTPASPASRKWKPATRQCRWTSWSVPCYSSEPALPILPMPFGEEKRKRVLAPPSPSLLSLWFLVDLVSLGDKPDRSSCCPQDFSIHHSSLHIQHWPSSLGWRGDFSPGKGYSSAAIVEGTSACPELARTERAGKIAIFG